MSAAGSYASSSAALEYRTVPAAAAFFDAIQPGMSLTASTPFVFIETSRLETGVYDMCASERARKVWRCGGSLESEGNEKAELERGWRKVDT
jgi:hypothetical protein